MEINVEETEYQIRVDSPLVPRQSTTIQSSPAQLFFARFRAIFLRNFAKQRRQFFTSLFHFVLPLGIFLIPLIAVWASSSTYTFYNQDQLQITPIIKTTPNECCYYDTSNATTHYCNVCWKENCREFIGVIDETNNPDRVRSLVTASPRLYPLYSLSPKECFLNPEFGNVSSHAELLNIYKDTNTYYGGGFAGYTLQSVEESYLKAVIHAETQNSYMQYFSILVDAFESAGSKDRWPIYRTIQHAKDIGSENRKTEDFKAAVIFTFVLPLALSFLLPAYLFQRVSQHGSSLDEYVRMLGVSKSLNEIVQYCFDYTLYMVVVIIMIVQNVLFRFSFFIRGSPLQYVTLFVLWGNTQISIAFALQSFFKSTRRAEAVGYILVFASMCVGCFTNVVMFDMGLPPWWYLLFPHLVLYRAVAIIMYQYYDTSYLLVVGPLSLTIQLLILYAILFVQSIVLFMFGIIIVPVTNYWKQREHVLKLSVLWKKIRHQELKRTESSKYDSVESEPEAIQEAVDPSLIIQNLSKSYGTHAVLRDLSMSIGSNECFGLLGKNGAGKTSLINVLCKIAHADSGTITINDLSLDEAHKQHLVALCPQFDILFDDLSVQDHILFLIRLKRVVSGFKNEYNYSDKLIVEFGLDEARRRLAKDLSGGMKRRLSLAMSLVGSPKVVLLDEPTTGLDPATRRDVWKVINTAVKSHNRCILLTTHSMEEAEALCNRVGIIHKGSLKCVGDIKFLKARFGTGHKVTINVEPTSNAGLLTPLSEVSSRVTEFVTSMLPNAVQEFHSDLYFIFRVPNIGMKLSELFKMMDLQSKRHKYGLAHEDGFTLNWSVNSASLEELFFRIVKPSMLLEQNK